MLTCKDFLQELSDYLDDTCGSDLRKELEKHVSDCPNCWVVVDTTKRTIQVYKGMDPQPISETVKSRLMTALQKKMSAGR